MCVCVLGGGGGGGHVHRCDSYCEDRSHDARAGLGTESTIMLGAEH